MRSFNNFKKEIANEKWRKSKTETAAGTEVAMKNRAREALMRLEAF